jgi:hypothetical protein
VNASGERMEIGGEVVRERGLWKGATALVGFAARS